MASTINTSVRPVPQLLSGAIGGLIGGLAFGAMMGMMRMLPMVAMLVKSESALVGMVVHLLISAIIGASFGLLFGSRSTNYAQAALWGTLYGAIWWVLGPLVLMPLMMGMGLQLAMAFSAPMLQSLVGHLIFGVLTGLAFVWHRSR